MNKKEEFEVALDVYTCIIDDTIPKNIAARARVLALYDEALTRGNIYQAEVTLRNMQNDQPWADEAELAEAIQARQVILRDVDGGTRIGTVTPADAAMLARVALSRPVKP